jgi:hypothetical protein
MHGRVRVFSQEKTVSLFHMSTSTNSKDDGDETQKMWLLAGKSLLLEAGEARASFTVLKKAMRDPVLYSRAETGKKFTRVLQQVDCICEFARRHMPSSVWGSMYDVKTGRLIAVARRGSRK